MASKKCTNCNGSGTISNAGSYRHDGQRSAGMGQSVCPSCNGSGKSSSQPGDSTADASSGILVFFILLPWGGAAFLYKLFDTEVAAGIGAAFGFGLAWFITKRIMK